MVMARNGRERWSAVRTSGNRYSCTANQFPKVTTTAEVPAEATVQTSAASANRQAANVSAVIRDKTRSDGVQPTSHNKASSAKAAPGAITANTSAAWRTLTPSVLLGWLESRPCADVHFFPSTIRRKKGLRAAVPADRQILRIRGRAGRGPVPIPGLWLRCESNGC